MKKLKKKVFLVIFLMLTLFIVSVLTITNYQNYQSQRESIRNILFKMDETRSRPNDFFGRNKLDLPKKEIESNMLPSKLPQNQNEQPRIFVDWSTPCPIKETFLQNFHEFE